MENNYNQYSDHENVSLLSNNSMQLNTYKSVLTPRKKKSCDGKTFAFFFIGTITMFYCIGELGIGLYLHSLSLMSDGFHNLSDVVSIIIGYVANKMKDRSHDQVMSYGYARTELIGAFLNACFLLSLSFYIILECIPRFIQPVKFDDGTGFIFIYVAAAGLACNTLGTIVFCVCGGGHGHSHAGGGHGHSHGGSKKRHEIEEETYGEDHGHSHSEKKKDKKHFHSEKEKDHGHSHSEKKKEKHSHSEKEGEGEGDHGHSHSEKKKEKKHSHGDKEGEGDHGHSHSDKKKKEKHSHSEKEGEGEGDHGHSHSDKKKKEKKHSHSEKGGEGDHGHSHSDKKKKHSHSEKEKDHGHSHGGHGHEEKEDLNMRAIFLHYFGDMISSMFVLAQGVLLHFFPDNKYSWAKYIDPSTSLIIVFIILITTIPLVKNVVRILVQSIPSHIDVEYMKQRINKIDGVLSLHDLHVWQLVDGVVISSVHINVIEDSDFKKISKKIKKIFHEEGIHSTSIQPEFVGRHEMRNFQYCEEMCVEDCSEDWCCKKPSDLLRSNELIIN